MQELRDTYYRLLEVPSPPHRRYLFDRFDTTRRLAGLIGPRGTGKTTLMLQWIRENEDPDRCLYASLDHLYFASHSLLDVVRDAHLIEGRTLFFLDEAHMYPGWSRELKNIYDAFPDVRVVFSGSSSLDLVKGQYDLSRRGVLHRLNGLSFREFLLFKTGEAPNALTLEDVLAHGAERSREVAKIPRLLGWFQEYLRTGYYPFYFEDPETYYARILNVIDKTIFEDIAQFYSLNTQKLYVFKRLLAYLASTPPGDISINTLARNLGVDHKTTSGYLDMLRETGLTHAVSLDARGKATLRAPDKMLLENANLYFAVAKESGLAPDTGSLRETFFVNALRGAGVAVHYSKEGDYRAAGRVFEIGGPGKTRKQVRGIPNALLVKDDMLTGTKGELPLYLFGLLW